MRQEIKKANQLDGEGKYGQADVLDRKIKRQALLILAGDKLLTCPKCDEWDQAVEENADFLEGMKEIIHLKNDFCENCHTEEDSFAGKHAFKYEDGELVCTDCSSPL